MAANTRQPTAPPAEKTGLAVSVWQPWAWLIVHNYKPIENRDWPTRIRGMVGVHAGLKFDQEGYDWVRATFPDIPMPQPVAFERGGIVGRVRIVDCVEDMDSPWFFGRYGFVLAEPEPLPFRACRGQLGFFRPSFGAEAAA